MQFSIKFPDGSILEYGQGAFDDWCIFLTSPDMPRIAPRDIDYFGQMVELAKKYTSQKLYRDFVEIYERTNLEIDTWVLNLISLIAEAYNEDKTKVEILFTIIYMGMIAEENKENTRLGKRIKRLGIHQILRENMPPREAANFSKGKNWREILRECERRGF